MSINYSEYVSVLIAKGHAAQKIAENYTQEKVNQLTGAIAYALTQPGIALKFGEDLVKESGMGIASDKQAKIFSKVKGAYYQMKGEKSVGLIEVDEKMGMERYARSIGVVGAIIPVTNGEATPIVKSLMSLKTRNAIILAPHPKAKKTNWAITEMIRRILRKFDAPEDLVQAVHPDYVNIDTSTEIMKQANFIIATGGTPMVRQAYSSGTPAIGVGTGNVVSIVDGTTNMNDVASMIIKSKIFDNATSCSTENSIIVFDETYDSFVDAMAKQGAHLIKENTDDKQKMLKTLWPESPANHVLNRHVVAQNAADIARLAEVKVPDGTKMIMVEENGGYSDEFPFAGEKLSPVAAVRRARDFDDAIQQTLDILEYQGKGHSCGIHTTIDERVTKLAEIIPVCKVVVNAPQCLTNSGSWTSGFPMSLTLGCGTWGHNSICHNATWKDLLNFTYVSRPIPSYQPKDEDLFDEEIRNVFK